MNTKEIELQNKVAYLESINDQLSAEIEYIDQLMRQVGFADGLAGVKATAQEVLEQGYAEETQGSDDAAAA